MVTITLLVRRHNLLTQEQIQQHIDEMDRQIPKEDAELIIWHDGHSTYEIIGNYIGYLRLGIEMLKAAVEDLGPGAVNTTVSINYMEVTEWTSHIACFVRRENVRKFIPKLLMVPPTTWKDYLDECFAVFLGIFVCVCLFVGFWQVLAWTWHVLV